jgi:peptidylprolyl isomerase
MRRLRPLAALVLALALVAAACGDDGGDDVLTADQEDAEAAGVPDATVGAAADDDPSLDAIEVTGRVGRSIEVQIDDPYSTETTYRRVLHEGDGDPIEPGQSVTFENVAVNGRDGTEFDNSYEAEGGTGTPSIIMDETQTIPGLVRGLLDVPVGSRVLVAVSPDDGFRAQGGVPDFGVEADDTVIFVVDVMDAVTPAEPLDRAEGTPVDPEPGLPTVALDEDTGKPTITVPDTDPPADLVVQPLIEGDGAEVQAGQTLTAHYTGVVWGGEQFDSSWDRGAPSDFQIGVGAVISGWDEGLVGQKVGSQVLLVIPPDQGYGPQGNPDAGIEGTDTLVFVVDILAAT